MAILQQLIEEARKLSIEEQKRLRAALDALDSKDGAQSLHSTHQREREWLNAHRDEYLGQWVALDGDQLIAYGPDARKVYRAAREQGTDAPYLDRVGPKEEAFMGGWQ
jgi:hypothetical protein